MFDFLASHKKKWLIKCLNDNSDLKNVAKCILIKFVSVIENIISPKCKNIHTNIHASFKLLYKLVVWHLAKSYLCIHLCIFTSKAYRHTQKILSFLKIVFIIFSLHILKLFFRSLDALGMSCRVVTSAAKIATYLVFKFGQGHL